MDEFDDDSAAMAAAMGFSSFGTQAPAADQSQGPAKRRKFNRQADAFVANHNTAPAEPQHDGSGANNIPLGTRRVREAEVPVVANEDEIALDDEDDDEDHGAGQDGPAYVDTSRPAPLQERQAEEARKAALLHDDPDTGTQLPSSQPLGIQVHGLPARPPPSVSSEATSTSFSQHRERGQRNPLWYVGYYDPSFNENPWAKLETARGLPEVGTWLRREQKA